MEFSATFMTIYGILQVGLVSAGIQWLKKKIPGEWPISTVLLSYVLSFGVAVLLKAILQEPNVTVTACFILAFMGSYASQAGKAIYSTKKQLNNNT